MKILTLDSKLKLTNKGFLEIVFLGTGTTFTKNLFNNNIIIIKGDAHLLVDFGFNAPVALNNSLKLDPVEIQNILLTHSHADHIGGVEYLALINKYIGRPLHNKNKLNLISTEEYADILWNYSLKGGLEWNEAPSKEKLKISDYFNMIYAKPAKKINRKRFKINFQGLELELFETNHIPDSAINPNQAFITYGVLIDNKVFYSSDTKFDPDLIDTYAEKAEVIFHDCSFECNPVHTSLEQLNTLPAEIKKKMYLMHYSDNWESFDVSDFAGLAKEKTRYIIES